MPGSMVGGGGGGRSVTIMTVLPAAGCWGEGSVQDMMGSAGKACKAVNTTLTAQTYSSSRPLRRDPSSRGKRPLKSDKARGRRGATFVFPLARSHGVVTLT